MLTIRKVFAIFCLLCLSGNGEYPGRFHVKSLGSSLELVPTYVLLLAKLKRGRRPLWSGQAKIYPLNYSTGGGNVS